MAMGFFFFFFDNSKFLLHFGGLNLDVFPEKMSEITTRPQGVAYDGNVVGIGNIWLWSY